MRELMENKNVKATSQMQTPQHNTPQQLIDSGLLLPTPVGEDIYFFGVNLYSLCGLCGKSITFLYDADIPGTSE